MSVKEIEINTQTITLEGLLKWAGIVGTGGEAKRLIQDGQVKVGGVVETRRSRKLRAGDEVELGFHVKFRVSRGGE